MQEPSGGLYEKQKHGRHLGMDRRLLVVYILTHTYTYTYIYIYIYICFIVFTF